MVFTSFRMSSPALPTHYRSLWLLALALLVIGSSVHADFHVNPNGNDSTGDGSLSAPWATLAHACNTLRNITEDHSPLVLSADVFVLNEPCILFRNISGVMTWTESTSTTVALLSGGIIYFQGNPRISAVQSMYVKTLEIQKDPSFRGAIMNWNGTIVIDSVAMTSNSSYLIRCNGACDARVNNCVFSGTRQPSDPLTIGLVQVDHSSLVMTNCTFINVTGFDMPAVLLTTTTVPTLISNTTFESIHSSNNNTEFGGALEAVDSDLIVEKSRFAYNRATKGSCIHFISLNAPLMPSLIVKDSIFVENDATEKGAGIFALLVDSVTVTDSTFALNFALDGTAMLIYGANLVNVTSSSLWANGGLHSGAYLGFQVQSTVFDRVVVQQTVSGLLPAVYVQGPALEFLCTDCTFANNIITHPISRNITGTSLFLADHERSEIRGGYFDSKPDKPYPAIEVMASSITIVAQNDTWPYITGATFASSNVSITRDWTLHGRAIFIDAANSTTPNRVFLNGHSLDIAAPLSDVDDKNMGVFQFVTFYDGAVNLVSGKHMVCCTIGNPSVVENVWSNASLNVFRDTELHFRSSLKPVIFTGPNAALNAFQTAYIIMISEKATVVTIPKLSVTGGATLGVENVLLDGSLEIGPFATLSVFPTWWGGLDRPMNVTGNATIAGALLPLDLVSFYPFSPLVTLQDPPSAVIRTQDALTYTQTPADIARISYDMIQQPQSIFFKPSGIRPRITVSNDLSALEIDIILDSTGFIVRSDCQGFIDFTQSANIDIASLRCLQATPSTIIVSSASLPYAPLDFPLDPQSIFRSSTIGGPTSPIPPVAYIRPLPSSFNCYQVTLDGTLSTGIGAFRATFKWSLQSTTDATYQTALSDLLASTILPTVNIPLTYLSANHQYVFGLQITNRAGLTSARTHLTFEPTLDAFIPPLSLDGPPELPLYTGSDLLLTTRVDIDGCQWDSSQALFSWTVQSSASPLETDLENASPSLWLPSAYFDPAITSYTFKAYVFPDPRLHLPTSANRSATIVVTPTPKPFMAIPGPKSTFTNEDVVLAVDVYSPGDSPVDCEWRVLACPNTVTDSFFGFGMANGLEEPEGDCYNSAGERFTFPFSAEIGLSTTMPRGSLEPGSYVVEARCYAQSAPSAVQKLVIPFTVQASAPLAPIVAVQFPPPSKIFASHKFSLSASVTNPQTGITLTGLDAEAEYDFFWRVVFGAWNVPPGRNGRATLVVPYSSLLGSQHAFISVEVRAKNKAILPLPGNATVQLPVSSAPTGGVLTATPSAGMSLNTLFNLTAPSWTSAFRPLKYQFAYIHPETGVELALNDLTSNPTLKNVLFEDFGSTDANVTVLVRVLDALGSISTATTQIQLSPAPPTTQPGIPAELLSQLAVSMNASNWRTASTILHSVTSSIKAGIYGATDDERALLLSTASTLPSSVQPTEANSASILSQLANIIATVKPQTNEESDQLLSLLQSILSAESSKFGTSSLFSEQSSVLLTQALSTILEAKANHSLGSAGDVDPVALTRAHLKQVIDGMMPGEPQLQIETGGLNLSSVLIPTKGTSETVELGSDHSSVIVIVAPKSLSGSAVDGYIGANVVVYNGTFPGPSTGFEIVLDVGFVQPSGTDVSAPYSAKFNLTGTSGEVLITTKQPSCSKYDGSSKTWSSSGCSTVRERDGTVSCHCDRVAPLSLVFGGDMNTRPSKHSKAVTIVIAVVIPVVVVAAIIGAVIIWKMNPLRRTPMLRPVTAPVRVKTV